MGFLATAMPKTNKPKRDDKAVKIERALADKAQYIARAKGLSIAEYLSDLVRLSITKEFPKAFEKLKERLEDHSDSP